MKKILSLIVGLAMATAVSAQEISFMCYQDGNECGVFADLIKKFEAKNSPIKVKMNVVGFEIVRDQLQTQLEAGSGPDVARVVNLAGLNKFYVDLTPHVKSAYWEQNYGKTLPWFRAATGDKGIYGWMTQLTVTSPFVNVSKFKEAGVALPGAGATWDDWAKASQQVKDKLNLYSGMVMDRTGHRFASAAMSYGAKYFDDKGNLAVVDDGFKEMTKRMIDWHKSGLMAQDIWPAASGAKWKNGAELFINQEAVFHHSGSFQLQNHHKAIGDKFEWKVVDAPCGLKNICASMIGGSGVVAFKHSKAPAAAAKFIDFLAQEENAAEFYAKTVNIPAHQGLQAKSVNYGDVPKVIKEGLKTYAANVTKVNNNVPQALALQANAKNFLVYNTTVKYVAAAITGELTPDAAYSKITEEIVMGTK